MELSEGKTTNRSLLYTAELKTFFMHSRLPWKQQAVLKYLAQIEHLLDMMEKRVLFSVILPLLYIDKNIFFPCSQLISQ